MKWPALGQQCLKSDSLISHVLLREIGGSHEICQAFQLNPRRLFNFKLVCLFIACENIRFSWLFAAEGRFLRAKRPQRRRARRNGCFLRLVCLNRRVKRDKRGLYWWLISNQRIRLCLENVLFGILTENACPLLQLLNYFIIIGKLYLWDCRSKQILPNICRFRAKIIAKYENEKKKSATKNSLKESGYWRLI